jgi:hypothetical protein
VKTTLENMLRVVTPNGVTVFTTNEFLWHIVNPKDSRNIISLLEQIRVKSYLKITQLAHI